MITALERIIDALAKRNGIPPRRVGAEWVALCPAHDDHNPSLGLRGIHGQTLICCRSQNCPPDQIMAALNLTLADLYDEPKGASYRYDDGRIVHRTPDKQFRQSGQTRNTPQLYQLNRVQAAVAAGQHVWLVEGEKDVHALETLGVIATTAPMGAANVSKCDLTPLHGAQLVIIPDQDDAGQRWLHDVLSILDGKTRSVTIGAPASGKDAADHIAAGHGLSEFKRVEQPDADENTRQLFPTLNWHELWAREDADEDWIVEPILPARRLIALYSAPKIGKSLLMLEVAAAIATGRRVLGVAPTHKRVLYVDLENDPIQDTRERLKAMGYKPDELDDLRVMSFPTLAYLDTPQGGQELLMAAHAWECEVIVIDTVSRVVRGEENDNDTWLAFYRNTGLAMKQADMTLIRLDHTGKDAAKGQRGGSAKSGDVDAVWKLELEDEKVLTLRCEAHRFPLPAQDTYLTLTRKLDPLRHEVSLEAKRDAFEARVARVMQVLAKTDLPASTGRDGVRMALKARGEKAGADAVNEAIRRRKRAGEMSEMPVRFESGQLPDRKVSETASDSPGQAPPETPSDLHKDLSDSENGQLRTGVSLDCPPSVPPYKGDSGQDTQADLLSLHPEICPACGWGLATEGHRVNCRTA